MSFSVRTNKICREVGTKVNRDEIKDILPGSVILNGSVGAYPNTKSGLRVRNASFGDVPGMIRVEERAWKNPSHRATREALESRIATYQRGSFLIENDGMIVGHAALQRVNPSLFEQKTTWSQFTDNGSIATTHDPDGDALYGVNLSIDPCAPAGSAAVLMSKAKLFCILIGAIGIYVSPRIPSFGRYVKTLDCVIDLREVGNQYIQLKYKDMPKDPELRLYVRAGAEILRLLPDFFPDKESMDFGVLAFWKNRMDKPFILLDTNDGYEIRKMEAD